MSHNNMISCEMDNNNICKLTQDEEEIATEYDRYDLNSILFLRLLFLNQIKFSILSRLFGFIKFDTFENLPKKHLILKVRFSFS